jgi:hypothetical protein
LANLLLHWQELKLDFIDFFIVFLPVTEGLITHENTDDFPTAFL